MPRARRGAVPRLNPDYASVPRADVSSVAS